MAGTTSETRTRTTVAVEEYEVHACPSCGQFCEEAELVPVVLNADGETVARTGVELPEHGRGEVLCRYCTAAIFDYEPETTQPIRAGLERVEQASRADKWVSGVLPTLVGLITVVLVLFVGLEIFTTMVEAMQAANEPIALAGEPTVGPGPIAAVDLVGVLVMLFVTGAAISVLPR